MHRLNWNGFDLCPTFLLKNLLNECWLGLNRSVTLSKRLNKIESLSSNGSRIKFAFDQTFARLPDDFSCILQKLAYVKAI